MKNVNLLEEKKKLEIGEYGEYLCNYNSGYVSDVFMEIADNNTSIYYSQMLKWLQESSDSVDYIERAVCEGLVDTSNFDFYRCISAGQYLQVIEELNGNEDDIKLNYALNYLINEKHTDELNEEAYEDLLQAVDYSDTIDGIIEEVDGILEPDEDEDDDENC